MREMASTIKTEVLAELNASRKRLHQTGSDFVDCNTLTSQVSYYRSTFRTKVKSHTSCRKQQQTKNDVSTIADVVDFVPICTHSAKETLGNNTKATSLAALAGGRSVQGSKVTRPSLLATWKFVWNSWVHRRPHLDAED